MNEHARECTCVCVCVVLNRVHFLNEYVKYTIKKESAGLPWLIGYNR